MGVSTWLTSIGLKETALQAAAIQGAFALLGIVLTGLLAVLAYGRNRAVDRRVARRAREERTLDLQSAIRAEARNHWHELEGSGNLGLACRSLVEKIESGRWFQPGFTPFVPRQVPSMLLATIQSDVAILDNVLIDLVVRYYRQRALVEQFAEDLGGDRYWSLPGDRKIEMIVGYYGMLAVLKANARDLNRGLERTLKLKKPQQDLNMLAWDPQSEFPASAAGSAASVHLP